jgi:hypothetical protein
MKYLKPSATGVDVVPFHKYSPGDGLHLVNADRSTLPDGRIQKGDPSDICIVSAAQRLCTDYGLPRFDLLWTETYPDDPMYLNDLDVILEAAQPYMNEFDPFLPATRSAILSDLRAISCGQLATKIDQLLLPFVQTEKILGDDEKKTPSD